MVERMASGQRELEFRCSYSMMCMRKEAEWPIMKIQTGVFRYVMQWGETLSEELVTVRSENDIDRAQTKREINVHHKDHETGEFHQCPQSFADLVVRIATASRPPFLSHNSQSIFQLFP